VDLLPAAAADGRWWFEAAQVVGSPGGPACQPRRMALAVDHNVVGGPSRVGRAPSADTSRSWRARRRLGVGRGHQVAVAMLLAHWLARPRLASSRPPDGAARRVVTTGSGAASAHDAVGPSAAFAASPPLVPRPCCAEQVVPLLAGAGVATRLPTGPMVLCASARPQASWLGASALPLE
jgi:hypothetical protein